MRSLTFPSQTGYYYNINKIKDVKTLYIPKITKDFFCKKFINHLTEIKAVIKEITNPTAKNNRLFELDKILKSVFINSKPEAAKIVGTASKNE